MLAGEGRLGITDPGKYFLSYKNRKSVPGLMVVVVVVVSRV